ncbi:hypothetical protein [Faecalispora jeddahensis]|nr:hypothetical protein [Faecalispora jeddahensis]
MERIVAAMLLIGAANGFWIWARDVFALVQKIANRGGKRNG